MMQLDTNDLLNLLKGIGPPYGGINGLTEFSGNQWNEAWKWDEAALRKGDDAWLWRLYLALKHGEAKLPERLG